MKRLCPLLTLFLTLCVFSEKSFSQDSAGDISSAIPSSYVEGISKKSEKLQRKMERHALKSLALFQKQQNKLLNKLNKKDSLAAQQLVASTAERAVKLNALLQQPAKFNQYIPSLDTLKTSLKFLEKNPALLVKSKLMDGKLKDGLTKIDGLEQQFQKADELKKYFQQQQTLLKEQLQKFGFTRELKKLNKQTYYYTQQIKEYKELVKDKKKLERKAIDLLSKTKLFQDFMKRNSMLASLFRMPVDDPTDPSYLQSLAGLQTRVQVNQLIQQQAAAGGPNALQEIKNNIMDAQSQLQQLKEKMMKAGGSGNSDEELPNFKPNNQRTKSFLSRLEVGANMQSQKSSTFFPTTSDIGLSVGYKLNDRSVIGFGAAYKMGWGKSLRQMRITHEGAGLRSFVDYNLKKSFWISGGFEMNYKLAFNKVEELKNLTAWQQSGLIGLSKKMSVSMKILKSTTAQLLWDFLSYRQLPRTQPIVFRLGYNFK